jgi:hypothetical protein
MFGSLPSSSDGKVASSSEPDKSQTKKDESDLEKKENDDNEEQENELKKLYQPFDKKKPVKEMFKTTVRPSKPSTTPVELDVLKKVQNLVSQYQTTTIIPKFGFDIAPIGNIGVIERTKTKEKSDVDDNKVEDNKNDPLMNNLDLLAPIRSKPISELYKPIDKNGSVSDLYNLNKNNKNNRPLNDPFDPSMFAPLSKLPKPSPLVDSSSSQSGGN